MNADMSQRLTLEHRLEEMERTLRRICAELDILAHGMRAALEALNCARAASNMIDQFEELRLERATLADMRDIPTQPSPAPPPESDDGG